MAEHTFTVDPHRRELVIDGVVVPTTRREFDIVALIAAWPNTVTSRQEIMVALYGPIPNPPWRPDELHVVDVHLSTLRRKCAWFPIETVRGLGFKTVKP